MRYFAWALGVLGLLLVVPAEVTAQDRDRAVQLEQNSPNPFNPETTIPFTLSEELWETDRPVVSLRIYNVLAQLVAVPVLQGTGERFDNIALEWNGTGRFEAYWDGKVLDTGREAASGVYVYQIVVNGRAEGSRKMTIIK
jgi:hypothetical protein